MKLKFFAITFQEDKHLFSHTFLLVRLVRSSYRSLISNILRVQKTGKT